jgi:myo-inositol-1(or 4)-monophosphatase
MSVNTLSTSVPIQLLSTFAALNATPCLITAGKVAPRMPVQPASRTSRATTFATASGVDGCGVRYLTRSVASAPRSRSTMAPLIPLPPMSTPNAVAPFLLDMTASLAAPDPTGHGHMFPMLTPDVRADDPRALLDLSVRLARGAGELIRAARTRADGSESEFDVAAKSSPTDLVSEVDRASERWLVERLAELRPGDAVLGEEGSNRPGESGVRWLVDPIDGTVNFLYGIPQYAVSVAAERDGQVVAGSVHDPSTGETFSAMRGGGAWLDGRRLPGRWRASSLDHAVVGTGFSYDQGRRAAQGLVLAGVLPRVANLRRLGSAALDLCYVAAGRLDAYFEQDLKPWDRAAGTLVAAEAGAVVSGLRGRPPGVITVAASPAVADELSRLLEELGADDV